MNDNELIAEFMGLVPDYSRHKSHEDTFYKTDLINDIWMGGYQSDMEFKKRWDHLMPVVDKIEGLGWIVGMDFSGCVISGGEHGKDFHRDTLGGQGKLKAVYDCVVEFIKWYNEQK